MLLFTVFVTFVFQGTYGHMNGIEQQLVNDGCFEDICWKDNEYPAERIMDKISSDMDNMNTFGEFGESGVIDNSARSCDLCEHHLSLRVNPLVAVHGNKKYFVVNTENYLQNITLTICKAPEQQIGSRCIEKEEILPNDLIPACEQKHTTIRLLCYDKDDDKFVGKTVRYPSACVCTIKKLNN